MKTHRSPKPDPTIFLVAFDEDTVAMLMNLAEACKAHPSSLISAIVHDVLADDAAAHAEPDVTLN